MKCTHADTNKEYAVKILNSKQGIRSEAEALKMCHDHPHIVQLVEVMADEVYTYIVTELLKGNELSEQVQCQNFTESEVRNIFTQLVNAVKFMHTNGIIHRDLKLENIMLANDKSNSLNLKIVDFGFACRRDSKDAGILCYTLEYVAPEVLSNKNVTEACDVWSLGVILYTLLCGRKPFLSEPKPRKEGNNQIKDRIRSGSFDRSSHKWQAISESAKDLVNRLLTVDVDKRLTIQAVAEHDWLIENVTYSSESALITEVFDSAVKLEATRVTKVTKKKPKRGRKPLIRAEIEHEPEVQQTIAIDNRTDMDNNIECENDVILGGDMEIEHDTREILVNGTGAICLPETVATEVIEFENPQEPQSSVSASLRDSEDSAIREVNVNSFSKSIENRSKLTNRSDSMNSSSTITFEPFTNANNGEPLNNNDKFIHEQKRLLSTHSAISIDDQIAEEVILDEEKEPDCNGYRSSDTLLSACKLLDIELAVDKISKVNRGFTYAIFRQRSTSSVGSTIKDFLDGPSSREIEPQGRKRKRDSTPSTSWQEPAAKKVMKAKSPRASQPKRITRSLARRPEIHIAPMNLDISVS